MSIDSLINAIDARNINTLNSVISNYNYNSCNNKKIRKDIVLEIYNKGCLSYERLKFIIENCNDYLYISSSLIKNAIKDDTNSLLEIILNNFSIYDNDFILRLLYQYKNK
ncbi:hypothetical protein H8356DRAFT_878470, partial [Neocallimastix lanati (nom. inval.)]